MKRNEMLIQNKKLIIVLTLLISFWITLRSTNDEESLLSSLIKFMITISLILGTAYLASNRYIFFTANKNETIGKSDAIFDKLIKLFQSYSEKINKPTPKLTC